MKKLSVNEVVSKIIHSNYYSHLQPGDAIVQLIIPVINHDYKDAEIANGAYHDEKKGTTTYLCLLRKGNRILKPFIKRDGKIAIGTDLGYRYTYDSIVNKPERTVEFFNEDNRAQMYIVW